MAKDTASVEPKASDCYLCCCYVITRLPKNAEGTIKSAGLTTPFTKWQIKLRETTRRSWQLRKNSRAWDSDLSLSCLCTLARWYNPGQISESPASRSEIKVALTIAKSCYKESANKSSTMPANK